MLVFSGLSAAAAPDPLQAPACRDALAALDVQERRAASQPSAAASRPELAEARRRAASACLTSRGDVPATPGRSPPPPWAAVPAAAVPRATVPSPATPARPVPQPAPPVVLGPCDATGCWTSDGTRLQRVGPDLLGPRGFCTTTGSVLNCP